VHYQLGKVIQMNQVHAKMIYWSIRSVQHISGNILLIIRSVRLRYLQHMVSCCCGGQGDSERQRGTIRPWTSIQDLLHPNSWQTPVAAVTV